MFGGGNVVDKIANGVDDALFSEQERAELLVEYHKATLPQNVARRIIAFMIIGFYIVLLSAACLLYKIDLEYSKFLFNVASETMLVPTTAIIGFYFIKRMGK